VQDIMKQKVPLKRCGCAILNTFVNKISSRNGLGLKLDLLGDSRATNNLNHGTA